MSTAELPDHIRSDINKIRSSYNSSEVTINRNHDRMVVEFFTAFKNSEMKLVFAFNINSIESTIDISIQNISSKNKHGINATAVGFITSMVLDKFNENIDKKPIYKSIEFFEQEFASKKVASPSSKSSSIAPGVPSKYSEKQKRKISKMKQIKQVQEYKIDYTPNQREYIAFLRYNRLLEGAQRKKETQILEYVESIKDCSKNFFVRLYYGTPGIICIGGTQDVIQQFVKKCNDIGKKPVISSIMDMNTSKYKYSKVNTLRNDKYNNQLLGFLGDLKLNDKLKTLDTILTGNATDFKGISHVPHHYKNKKNKNKKDNKKTAPINYVEDSKYEFNVYLGVYLPYSYGYDDGKNGHLSVTIFGQNDNKLVSKYKYQIKRWSTNTIKLEFQSIEFLNKIGDLTKIQLDNHCKKALEFSSVKISVYQIINGKNNKKATNNPPILRKQYEKRKEANINRNSSLIVNLQ